MPVVHSGWHFALSPPLDSVLHWSATVPISASDGLVLPATTLSIFAFAPLNFLLARYLVWLLVYAAMFAEHIAAVAMSLNCSGWLFGLSPPLDSVLHWSATVLFSTSDGLVYLAETLPLDTALSIRILILRILGSESPAAIQCCGSVSFVFRLALWPLSAARFSAALVGYRANQHVRRPCLPCMDAAPRCFP
jgi:hypothetical protein